MSISRPFILPDIWDDDDSMFELFQAIKRPKHVDPGTYDRKVNFWRALLLKYVEDQRVLVVSIRALKEIFSRHFIHEGVTMYPGCLGEVISCLTESELVRTHTGSLTTVQKMMKYGWEYLVESPYRFAVHLTVGSNSGGTEKTNEDQLFEFHRLADSLLKEFFLHLKQSISDKRLTLKLPAYELSDFETILTEFFPHDATRNYIRELCVGYYGCVRIEKVSDSTNDWTAQIVLLSDSSTEKVSALSKPDYNLLAGLTHLNSVIKNHEIEEKKLLTEIEDRRSRIKTLMAGKKLREAKNLLSRTKILEKSLETKQQQLNNLEAMKMHLDSSCDNQAVLHALSESGRVLKQTTGGSAGLAKVEDTMDTVAQNMQDTNELSDMIAAFAQNSLNTPDKDDLEEELRTLTKPVPTNNDPLGDVGLNAELARLCVNTDELPKVPSYAPRIRKAQREVVE